MNKTNKRTRFQSSPECQQKFIKLTCIALFIENSIINKTRMFLAESWLKR